MIDLVINDLELYYKVLTTILKSIIGNVKKYSVN